MSPLIWITAGALGGLILLKGAKKGATLASCNFPLPGWKPVRPLTADSESNNDPIYIYRKV